MRWFALILLLALAGCASRVDREAMAFPDMPGMPIYHRLDGTKLPPWQAMDALQAAENECMHHISKTGSRPTVDHVGSPPFDACMRSLGYRRVG